MSQDHPGLPNLFGKSLMMSLSLMLIAVLSLGLIACGDDDDGGDDATATTADTADGDPTATGEEGDGDPTATSEEGDGDPTATTGSGGGDSTLAAAQAEGAITIGFANEAPYGFANAAGEVTGEAPTVAREVLAELGIDELIPVVVPFGSLIPGLEAGRFDIIAAGMFINPDRCQQIQFSDPDYCVPQAFGVAEGNPLGIESFEDIAANADITVGIPTGTVEETYATSAGVSEDQIQSFPTIQDAGEALADGRVDAIAATSLAIEAEVERLGGGVEATPGFEVTIDGEPASGCGGFGFRTGDTELYEAFNEVLVGMKENDEIRPLVEEFGFDDEVEAAKGRTAEELCAP